ncbi:homocitrate synthase [Chloroherpeton thalassium ATCC 35110]|uniref:Homocitrate synthase n=1 Tax=Chloroherpeton thalassium (strain ATCC 35110 / GB-78) TaxID=517418 RepID=B3QSR5_CHLT3|nr:homocitrate synthase [Chloroherpeton thalassium]ACF14112.1 homocitrate synthase [Chloroherpeton thalassium ATCC 35110]
MKEVLEKSVYIVDTTLRDGEQAPDVVFEPSEKINIARKLSEIGVDELEIGIPSMGDEEVSAIKTIVGLKLPVRLTSWCRAKQEDIDAAAIAGTEGVHISFPVSEIHLATLNKNSQWVLDEMMTLVPRAKKRFGFVSIGAQDATRVEVEFLKHFAQAAEAAGADRLRIADTVGISTPMAVFRIISEIQAASAINLEFHAHNDLGMATANAFMAVEAGCHAVSVTALGLGERAGNAALEELAMALKLSGKYKTKITPTGLQSLCQMVADASGRKIHAQKPVVGKAAFQHESGIHCAALLKNPNTYQPFLPEEIGKTSAELVIGKHSGTAAISHVLKQRGISIEQSEARILLPLVRRYAGDKKRAITSDELESVYRSCYNLNGNRESEH